jgi:predicted HicB family RNase H-like nuclease
VSRLTLRLPETLHQQLASLAEREGISLNQYIVYALTRQTTSAYTVKMVPEAEVEREEQTFQSLIKRLGQASPTEVESILAARESAEPEPELSADLVARIKERIGKRK